MAAKSIVSGELYFVGEKDPITNHDTQFVKIGIVRNNESRNTDYRVREHQTGNPRLLHTISTIQTPIVERVETTMHGKYATMRISGEWFVFSPSQRLDAIETANALAGAALLHEIEMSRAEELKAVTSFGDDQEPSEDLRLLHHTLVQLRAQIRACKSMAERVVRALENAARNGANVDRMLTIQEKKATERFDEKTFRDSFPELWTQFITVESVLKGSFSLLDPAAARPDPYKLFPELMHLKSRVDEVLHIQDFDPSRLHALFLEVISVQSPSEWDVMLLEDRLKAECGTSPGLTGICKWSREEVSKEVFDKARFKAERPDLFPQFVTVGAPTRAIVPARDLGFRI